MNEIHEVAGLKLAELRDVMTERKQWRRLAMMVARVPGTDSTRCQGELIKIFFSLVRDEVWWHFGGGRSLVRTH